MTNTKALLRRFGSLTLAAFGLAVFGVSFATAAPRRLFGKSAPFRVSDLPSSPLRSKLESLPAAARDHALERLHAFDFPAEDISELRADTSGDIYYEDVMPLLPASSVNDPVALSADAVDNPFALHSRPGAPNTVYLDFTGMDITGTAWNGTILSSTPTFHAKPFSLDSDLASFSASEKAAIAEIWHRVAEDFAVFNIDVTTEEPAIFGPLVGRVLITANVDANGVSMPSSAAGGVAYVGVWGNSNYATRYSPALVYQNNLLNGTPYIAEAAAHEFGHNLGLSHDGVVDGTKNTICSGNTDYFCGQGTGNISWGPIMGVGYYTNVTEWSKGEYPSANNPQDDLAIIQGKLGLAPDEHGDTRALAADLVIGASGTVTATTPQTDPNNLFPRNKGVIGPGGDRDVFRFDAGAGTLNLTVRPAWAAFTRSDKRGANLDLRAVLMDNLGNTLDTANITTDTYATIARTVAAGTYYLEISAIDSVNYSTYACQGEYFITGLVPNNPGDSVPPSVAITSPANGTTVTAVQTVSIQTSASDNVGVAHVDFYDGATFKGTDTTAPYAYAWAVADAANGAHTWTAKAFDAAGNVATSSAVLVTVAISDGQPPAVAITAPAAGASFTTPQTVVIQASASDNVGVARVEFYDGATLKGTDATTPYSYSWTVDDAANGAHTWTAKAFDAAGNVATAAVSVTVAIPDTQAPSVAITAPAAGASFTTPQTVTIQASASDNVGVTRIEFFDGTTLKGTDTTAPYTQSWAVNSTANGAHTWTAKAFDAAGNVATAAVSVTVAIPDTQAPSVAITAPAGGASFTTPQIILLQATATDDVGIARVEFYDGDVRRGVDAVAPYTYAWTINNTVNGAHDWTAKAYDAAGNNTRSQMLHLVVDIPEDIALPPPVAVTYPNPAREGDAPVLQTAIAGDGSDVTGIEFTIYDASGRVAHSGTIPLENLVDAGGEVRFTQPWTGAIASGRYHAVIVIHRTSGDRVVRTGLTIVR